jgi:hypothetical protein
MRRTEEGEEYTHEHWQTPRHPKIPQRRHQECLRHHAPLQLYRRPANVPELTWILFLRILDEREMREAEEAEAVGLENTPSLASPYRWRDWAAPYDGLLFRQVDGELPTGWKRREL